MKFITITIIILAISVYGLAQSDNIKCSLVLNHSFTYSVPPTNFKITITGEIPFSFTQNFATYKWFPDGEVLDVVSSLSGGGTAILKAEGNMDLPDLKIEKLNYHSKVKIDIEGKTRFVKVPEAGGSIKLMNLKLTENWDGDIVWDIKTDDPDGDPIRLKAFKMFAPTTFPDSPPTDKTLEYIAEYLYEDQTFEQTTNMPGMGTFTWQYTLKYNSVKTNKDVPVEDPVDPKNPLERSSHLITTENDPKVTANPKNEQDNYETPPKSYIKNYQPRIGPPLESIKWEIVDENTAPIKR